MSILFKSFAVLISLIPFLSTGVAKTQDDLEILAEKAKPSVVSVTTYDKSGNVLTRGTGFFIDESGLIVTRRRVLATGANRAEIRTLDGKTYPVKRISVQDPQFDIVIAFVGVPKNVAKPLRVSEEIPQAGESVVVIVGDTGSGPEVIKCSVTVVEDSESGKLIRVTGSIGAGSNGSPVINRKGEVVGVAVYLKEGEQSFSADTGEVVAGLYDRSQDRSDIERPKLLNRPQPSYTMLARANKVEGVVRTRVLVGEDGKVQRVVLVNQLPDGLNEEAVKAVYKMKFKPAMREGRPIKFWIPVEVEFNLKR